MASPVEAPSDRLSPRQEEARPMDNDASSLPAPQATYGPGADIANGTASPSPEELRSPPSDRLPDSLGDSLASQGGPGRGVTPEEQGAGRQQGDDSAGASRDNAGRSTSSASPSSSSSSAVPPPTNPMVTALLTDLYQLTMAYAYWKAGKHRDHAVFDLLHRKNPFGGEYTIFAGLEECVRFAANLRFLPRDIDFLRTVLPRTCEEEFFEYLATLDCSAVRIFSVPEGYVCSPRVPMMRIEGPLLVAQLLETTFLVLVNYASLVATNAARHRRVAGDDKLLLEFGLRRAQGPDGAMSASRYCYMGGFDATSNVEAARVFGIPCKGTHSHAFVTSFMGFHELKKRSLAHATDPSRVCSDFVALVQHWLKRMQSTPSVQAVFFESNESELASFTSYALAFPSQFQALVDTYDVIRSGVPNFTAVALALNDLGYKAAGIRLDSGDLAYLSQQARHFFRLVGQEFGVEWLGGMAITASNDINEETLEALNKQGHEIDAFGIGTHLVTCARQPALGCVYKLVEINGQPRIKLSEDMDKVTIPGRKECFRLYGREGFPLVDLMLRSTEKLPKPGARILCRHPFRESKRAIVIPQRVERLYRCYWSGPNAEGDPVEVESLPPLVELRERCRGQLGSMREDHIRSLNPTPYKVSVSDELYMFIHDLWLAEAPIGELR